MTRTSRHGSALPPALAALAACALLLAGLATQPALAASGAWTVMPGPFTPFGPLNDVTTFGRYGVVAVGDAGAVALSTDGGRVWSDRSPSASGVSSAKLRAAAFTDADHGVVVGDAGTILVMSTADTGAPTWTVGISAASGTIFDVAMDGLTGYAVGEGGLVLETNDGGLTWTREAASLTSRDLLAVALWPSGLAVAVGAGGTVLVRTGDTWQASDTGVTDDLIDVTLYAQSDASAPVIYCCSASQAYQWLPDGASLASLGAPPFAPASAVKALAAMDRVSGLSLLAVGTSGALARYDGVSDSWSALSGPLSSDLVAAASPGGSVAFVASAAGQIERTLSAGQTPLALAASPKPATASAFDAIIALGGSATLTGTVHIEAGGSLILEKRPAGSDSWQALKSVPWPADGDSFSQTDKPTVNTSYRLRFVYAGDVGALSSARTAGVRHKVSVRTTSFRLHVGNVYRVRGTVSPAKPGGVVEVWTDRAGNHKLGAWHRIGLGGYVKLTNGTTFITRKFGTPVRETYHLKVFMRADSQHVGGWSPRITVTVS
jgi:photosystem II stability/assembly factor-like uncharacterized protein